MRVRPEPECEEELVDLLKRYRDALNHSVEKIVMTPSGPKHKEIVFPESFDVVMGNPPYTRWTEIPDDVQKRIEERLGDLLTKYNLRADVRRGREPGLYVYFVMWGHKFLKPGAEGLE